MRKEESRNVEKGRGVMQGKERQYGVYGRLFQKEKGRDRR